MSKQETAQHTPGPWVLELNNHPNEVGDHNYSLFTNGYEFGKYNDESLVAGFDTATPNANARLIAAAPELLEALEALECAIGGECMFPDCDSNEAEVQRLRAIARVAIAKARP